MYIFIHVQISGMVITLWYSQCISLCSAAHTPASCCLLLERGVIPLEKVCFPWLTIGLRTPHHVNGPSSEDAHNQIYVYIRPGYLANRVHACSRVELCIDLVAFCINFRHCSLSYVIYMHYSHGNSIMFNEFHNWKIALFAVELRKQGISLQTCNKTILYPVDNTRCFYFIYICN